MGVKHSIEISPYLINIISPLKSCFLLCFKYIYQQHIYLHSIDGICKEMDTLAVFRVFNDFEIKINLNVSGNVLLGIN